MLHQNQAIYDAAAASLTGRADIAAFVARVGAMGPGCIAEVFVNPCSRYWAPGSPANFSLYIGLKDERGFNLLSYNGGGRTPEVAIQEAEEYLREFILKLIRDPTFCYSEADVEARREEMRRQAAAWNPRHRLDLADFGRRAYLAGYSDGFHGYHFGAGDVNASGAFSDYRPGFADGDADRRAMLAEAA